MEELTLPLFYSSRPVREQHQNPIYERYLLVFFLCCCSLLLYYVDFFPLLFHLDSLGYARYASLSHSHVSWLCTYVYVSRACACVWVLACVCACMHVYACSRNCSFIRSRCMACCILTRQIFLFLWGHVCVCRSIVALSAYVYVYARAFSMNMCSCDYVFVQCFWWHQCDGGMERDFIRSVFPFALPSLSYELHMFLCADSCMCCVALTYQSRHLHTRTV